MPRILIFEPRRHCNECRRMLEDEGYDLVICQDRFELFDALAEHPANAVVYVLGKLSLDLDLLALVRRVAPSLPVIVLGGPAGLGTRRSMQDLRPTYYGVFPLDHAELRDAVRGAIASRGRDTP